MNLYYERDIEELGHLYVMHVDAMTREHLHSKSAIAAELAVRDHEIQKLKTRLESVGICGHCLKEAEMDEEGPFSYCDCGTGEDYAKRPLQELQMLKRLSSLC